MTTPEIQQALRALLRDKVHVRPASLARLPSSQAGGLRSPLALARLALEPLNGCPVPLLRFWHGQRRGHVVIGPDEQGYRPGIQVVGRRELDGVAWLAARQLLAAEALAWPLANLLDHLLGSAGQPGGGWLSDGAARNPAWQEVAGRLQRQFRLGYGPQDVAGDPHAYFAWGLRGYLANRQALSVADPGLERLLDTTICDAGFWRRNPA